MYTRRFRILWEGKKVFLIIYVGFLVINKNIDNTEDREEKALFACTVPHILLFYLFI